MRLKATLERGIRLGKNFTSKIMEAFQSNVMLLGQTFDIDKQAIEVFSESFIRSHLVF